MLRTEGSGGVVVWTLDNAAKRNALDLALCKQIGDALAAAPAAGTRAIVLTGAGDRAFSAGFDVGALGDPAAVQRAFSGLMDAMAGSPVPIVCALNGPAYGGGLELAAACDMRLAHPGVKLMMPPAKLGIVYSERGLARFSALAGESRARRMFLCAEVVDAETAARWGLVDDVVGDYELLPRARDRAADIAALAPLAVQGMRRAFEALIRRRAELAEVDRQLIDKLRAEAWSSEDAAEGRAALAARRPPVFKGR